MTTHAILIPNQIAATNIDSFTRSAVSAVDVDNGNIVVLTAYGAASGQAEVWTGTTPATTTPGLTDVWMVYDPEIVWTGSYRGLDPDLRNFYTAATRVYSIFKPQLHDIFTLSTNGINGSIGANTFINCTNTGGLQPSWASTIGSSVFAAKLLATTYISLGMGSIDSNRVVAYQFEVVAL
jgi:hypothetical protein